MNSDENAVLPNRVITTFCSIAFGYAVLMRYSQSIGPRNSISPLRWPDTSGFEIRNTKDEVIIHRAAVV